MPDQPVYVRRPGLHAAAMDGEVVMLDVEQGTYFGLNGVAGFLWEQLATPQTLDSLCESTLAEYDVDAATCRREAEEFVATLLEHRLVVRDPA